MPARSDFRAAACLAALFLAGPTSAQPTLTIFSLDQFRTDRISGESRHEILPVAVFDGAQFRRIAERGAVSEANARRERLLAANPRAQVLFRGRRIGVVDVSDTYSRGFHCTGLVVGSGAFEPDGDLPESEMRNSTRNGTTVDYTTQTFFAISGASDEMRPDGDALVAVVNDPAELERYAMDVASIEPRANLLPLGEDETRAYRLDRYDAVVVVRKRRSRVMVPFPPVSGGLPSPLMTDIVVVRTVAGERVVHPLYRSVKGTDSWGKGEPSDRFIDAFEIEQGTAYLAFHRRHYEAQLLRLFRLGPDGAATLVFEDDLYGC